MRKQVFNTMWPVMAALAAGLWLAPATADDADVDVSALSNGYALLYQTVGKLSKLQKVLYVKIESDPVDALATELGEHADTIQSQIEKYAETHPGLDLEKTGLPEIDKQRRSNTTKALLKDMATHSGAEFERLYLLALTNVTNQSRHIASALADMPQDASGKKLAKGWHQQMQDDYEAIGKLLQARYFCDPKGE